MELVDVSIVATSIKVPQQFFNRSYTVTSTQQYHIKVQLKSSQYVIKKRYSEFYAFYTLIKKTIQDNTQISPFPQKSFRPMSTKVIHQRKNELEIWIKCLIRHKVEIDLLSSFLCVSKYNEKEELSPDELLVKKFAEEISKNPNRKIAFLDKFQKDFFIRRRIIDSDIAEGLFEVLIPICADINTMGKSLDIICKLTNRDYYRFYDFMIGVFTNLPLNLLKQMNLKDYMKLRINPDSQRKAYEILKILENAEKNVEELLGFDEEAIRIFRSWGMCQQKSVLNSYKSELISLIKSKEMNLSYKIEDKTVLVIGNFETVTDIEKIVDLFVSPFERKEWDLNLVNMIEEEEGLKMYYEAENKIYEFDVMCEKLQTPSSVEIKMSGVLSESDLGEFTYTFSAKSIKSNDSFESGKLSCSLTQLYKGKATKLVIYDLIGEETKLQNSFRLLLDLSQTRSFSFLSRCKTNSIHESIMRKTQSYVCK